MADNKNGPIPPLNLRESLDLSKNNSENSNTGVAKIELAPLPEQFETIKPSAKTESVVDDTKTGIEQADPRGIIATGQARQLQEIRFKEIEDALADGLENIYLAMDSLTQQRFKSAGEEASRGISDLIASGKATARKIIDIIRRWLSIAPGINKFFLEQEAKIKTDKIMNINNKYV